MKPHPKMRHTYMQQECWVQILILSNYRARLSTHNLTSQLPVKSQPSNFFTVPSVEDPPTPTKAWLRGKILQHKPRITRPIMYTEAAATYKMVWVELSQLGKPADHRTQVLTSQQSRSQPTQVAKDQGENKRLRRKGSSSQSLLSLQSSPKAQAIMGDVLQ